MKGDCLGDRMKRYEAPWKNVLPWRLPVIVRVDGKAFHTWTRGLARPFDVRFAHAMDEAGLRLCEEMQGAKLALVQSDEISVLVYPWTNRDAQPWFGNELQKITSVAASIAAAILTARSAELHGAMKPAFFDARVMTLPEDEVENAFIWRQQDASRNSLQALAQSLYPQADLKGKRHAALHEMCFEKGHNYDALPIGQKRGRCIRRDADGKWHVDHEPPIFTRDRAYITDLMRSDVEAA
ncbi:MAG: hypothetical protein HOW73_15160 [Polyangiaceae bacterium]|nr:hypothetical protein [Polyangiaceae bacterium]